MSRLCVRVTPNAHPTDPALTLRRIQEGEVVEILPDTHQFSFCELNNGHYRIIDLPGVPFELMAHLVEERLDAGGVFARRRHLRLDPILVRAQQGTTTRAGVEAMVQVAV